MATLDEIGQEKQRISERLARLDAERSKLADQLNELEIAERVLTRFGGKAETTERRRRGRPARTAPAARVDRKARGGQQAPGVSLSDATLQAVRAHGEGATASESTPGPFCVTLQGVISVRVIVLDERFSRQSSTTSISFLERSSRSVRFQTSRFASFG